MLGVPLVAGGRLVGVLHVGTLQPRRFSEDDTAVLQLAADRIATTLNSEQTAAERTAARTLQQSLLPTRLPEVDGLEFASRFATAEDFGVGGDWYDTFRLPDDQVGVVIGDVAGHGLPAAVVMGRLRSALRAYAIESATPGQALDRLRRKFAHFEPGKMATVLYITIAADLASFTIASTGHFPPVIAVPGREPILLDCSSSPPIGAPATADHVDVVCELSPGTTVGCYTDGLVERRDVSIDDRLERLRAAFYAGDVEDVCGAVAAELIGPEAVEDDTALLVFRRCRNRDWRGSSANRSDVVVEVDCPDRSLSAPRACSSRRRQVVRRLVELLVGVCRLAGKPVPPRMRPASPATSGRRGHRVGPGQLGRRWIRRSGYRIGTRLA